VVIAINLIINALIPDLSDVILGPCALTQIVGIASTLIIVRIGLGTDFMVPQSHNIGSDMEDIEVGGSGSLRL